jgi:hypothetical protein
VFESLGGLPGPGLFQAFGSVWTPENITRRKKMDRIEFGKWINSLPKCWYVTDGIYTFKVEECTAHLDPEVMEVEGIPLALENGLRVFYITTPPYRGVRVKAHSRPPA